MAEQEVTLDSGFIVENNYQKIPSETFTLPVKIAKVVNLFHEMGILLDGNAYLASNLDAPKRGQRPRRVLSVQIAPKERFAEIRPFAAQAAIVELAGRRYEEFENLRLALDAQMSSINNISDLSLASRGKYRLLRNYYSEQELSSEDMLKLVRSSVPIEKMLVSLREGLDTESILILDEIPDAYWSRLMGES